MAGAYLDVPHDSFSGLFRFFQALLHSWVCLYTVILRVYQLCVQSKLATQTSAIGTASEGTLSALTKLLAACEVSAIEFRI